MIKATYRGLGKPVLDGPDDLTRHMLFRGAGVEVANSSSIDVSEAQLAKMLAADPDAIFDVESAGTPKADAKLARELERRGVSVHPNLGGSKQPKGHPRWEAK
jgi:hypothetical protein